MTSSRPTDTLVICTRNRARELATCLASVQAASPLPDRVLIVDSSDDPELARGLVEGVGFEIRSRINYLHTAPGLPLQRNIGVANSDTDIVHFIDDDVVVSPEYFGSILDAFLEPDVVGVCGFITNLGQRKRPSLFARRFFLDGEDGRVLPSGRNVLNFEPGDGVRPTDWLSGCSMSYRRRVLTVEQFDERLSGYALGEDVDLSSRVRGHGRLVFQPTARVVHDESPSMRWSHERVTRSELRFRHQRVRAGHSGERMWAFWWSVVGQFVRDVGNAVRGSRHSAKHALWTCRGVADIALKRGSW